MRKDKLLKEILEARREHEDARWLAQNVTGDYGDVGKTAAKLEELTREYRQKHRRPVPIPSRRVDWHADLGAELPPYPQPANLRREMMQDD
jgi:hypothetical protein